MKPKSNVFSTLILLTVLGISSGVLSSCGDDSSASMAAQPAEDPMTSDLTNLAFLENALPNVGLKLVRVYDGHYEDTDGYAFNPEYLRRFREDNRDITVEEMIATLHDYIGECHRLLERWGDQLPDRRSIDGKARVAQEEKDELEREIHHLDDARDPRQDESR